MEIEAKFNIPNTTIFTQLQQLSNLANYSLFPPKTKRVYDCYLDTATQSLLATQYALRQRQQPEGVLLTLKGLGGIKGAVHHREELEVMLSDKQPKKAWLASSVYNKVCQLIGPATLQILFCLQQTRTVRQINQGDRVVAELSLDAVNFKLDDEEQIYFELEIELAKDGTEDDLEVMTTCLLEEWDLTAQSQSKFERALAFLEETASPIPLEQEAHLKIPTQIQAPPSLSSSKGEIFKASLPLGGIEGGQNLDDTANLNLNTAPKTKSSKLKLTFTLDDSISEAARKIHYFLFQRMIHHEPGTRLGENIEALHDMRVAVRRMRAVIDVLGDYLDLEAMRPFIKGLRRTGRALGKVRDLDVFWEKTGYYLTNFAEDEQPNLEPLKQAWNTQRTLNREEMLVYLDSKKYRKFKKGFANFLQQSGAAALPLLSAKGTPRPYRLQHIIPIIVYKRLAAVLAYEGWLQGPDVPLERLHQLRIDCKRLRYTLEFFRSVLGPQTKPLIQQIKGLQNHLGNLQDAVVAIQMLQTLLNKGILIDNDKTLTPIKSSVITESDISVYLLYRQEELQQLVDIFPDVWESFKKSEFIKTLAFLVSQLITN